MTVIHSCISFHHTLFVLEETELLFTVIVAPEALKAGSVGIEDYALTFSFVLPEAALEANPALPGILASAVLETRLPHALISITIGKEHLSEPVFLAALKAS